MLNPNSFDLLRELWHSNANAAHLVQTELTQQFELCRKFVLSIPKADHSFIRTASRSRSLMPYNFIVARLAYV